VSLITTEIYWSPTTLTTVLARCPSYQ